MHKKLFEIFLLVGVIIGCIWLIIESFGLPQHIQIFLIVALVCSGTLFVAFPKIPVDFKIICLLCLGYAFAGRGFAYISPMEPLYIGEIVWIIGMAGYIYRLTKGSPLFPTWLHLMMLLWMITVGLYLMSNYAAYGKLAIRDSVIGYYAMFAFYGYAVFQRNNLARSFGLVLKVCVLFACLGLLLLITGGYEKIVSISPVISFYFGPHPDAFLPLIAAGGMYCLLEGIRRKSLLRILAGIAMALLLFTTKTAGIFCFFVLLAYMILFGRRTDLILTSSIAVAIAAVGIGVLFTIDSTKLDQWVLENEHLSTFAVGGTGSVETSATTNWRLAWWETVYDDTMAENPMFGLGLGSDLSSNFLQSYMRIDLSSEEARNYARYPHSILLTVFGRLGFVGIAVFLALILSLCRILIKVTGQHRHDTSDDGKTLLLAQMIVIAGMANGLVQATYEVPYGAIMYWFCIGYVIAYYNKNRNQSLSITEPQPQQP